MAEVLQEVGVDGRARINLVKVVGGAGYAVGKPHRGTPLLVQHFLNPVSDMYVLDLGHD